MRQSPCRLRDAGTSQSVRPEGLASALESFPAGLRDAEREANRDPETAHAALVELPTATASSGNGGAGIGGSLAVGEMNAVCVEQADAEVAPEVSIEALETLTQVERYLHRNCNLSRVQAKALTGRMKAIMTPAPKATDEMSALADLLRANISALQKD